MPFATATPAKTLLTPYDHALILIDHQSQMAFATKSIDLTTLRNNVALVAKAARSFHVPTILTTIAATSFSGPMFSEITEVFPEYQLFDRTSMNTWEDAQVIEEVNRTGKSRIVLAGLWTSVCVAFPALSAIEQGFDVSVIADACGDITEEAHEMALHRMIRAGVQPLTSLMYMLELQRDWARTQTYDATTRIARDHGGSYGVGLAYAKAMFEANEGQTGGLHVDPSKNLPQWPDLHA